MILVGTNFWEIKQNSTNLIPAKTDSFEVLSFLYLSFFRGFYVLYLAFESCP